MDGQNVDNRKRREAAVQKYKQEFGDHPIELIPVQAGLKKTLLDDALGTDSSLSLLPNDPGIRNRYQFGQIPASSNTTEVRNPKSRYLFGVKRQILKL